MPGPDELSLFVVRLEAIGGPYMVLDIRAIREVTGVDDEAVVAPWLESMGLGSLWQEIKATR